MTGTIAPQIGSHDSKAASGEDEIFFSAEEAGVTLSVVIAAKTNRLFIRQARHSGTGDSRAFEVMETFCSIIAGRPLQEAADHGAIYTVHALPKLAAKVPGISTPHNAGPEFMLAQRLMRKVHAAACRHFESGPRENHWYLRAATEWQAKSEAEQAAELKPIVADFLRQKAFPEGSLWISKIEKGTRVTVAFADNVIYNAKPGLLMALEQHLRNSTGNPIELFMDELKDANKIRRL